MMREKVPRTLPRILILLLVLIWGPTLSGCLPLPIVDAQGVLKSAVLDSWGSVHVVTDGYSGIHYGVINGISMTPELVTSEGSLGGENWYPFGAGRDVLAMAPDGTPHVLYYSNSSGSLMNGDLTHAWKEAGVWESEIVQTVEGTLSHPSIVVDSVGDVHVSYAELNYPSGDIEVRYARKHNGEWSEELIETVSGLPVLPVLVSRIALDPDEKPIIVTGASGPSGPENVDAVIRVAQPAVGGGWDIEQIFTYHDPCIAGRCIYGSIDDLSVAVGPTGEKAVGLEFSTSQLGYVSGEYDVIANDGSGWTTDAVCSYWGELDSPPHCGAGDVAISPSGQIYAMFIHFRYDGNSPDAPLRQSLILAHKAGTGWVEEIVWDNTLYNVEVNDKYMPHLLLPSAYETKIVYEGPTLMYMMYMRK